MSAARWRRPVLANALDPIRESDGLLHDGGFPFAQFLIGAAWEEVLEAQYCIGEGASSWDVWWVGSRRHDARTDMRGLVIADSIPAGGH